MDILISLSFLSTLNIDSDTSLYVRLMAAFSDRGSVCGTPPFAAWSRAAAPRRRPWPLTATADPVGGSKGMAEGDRGTTEKDLH
jgi:hypothetical protein